MNGTEPAVSMVRLTDIHKRFETLEALRGVSLEVRKGEVISIIGPSGSGKSTLLRCINGLERIDRGRIEIEGELIAQVDERGKRRHLPERAVKAGLMKLGMVFQHFNLFPHMTVLGNVTEAPVAVKGMKRAEAETLALGLLEKVGLADKKDAYPAKISGGQKQRVAIARALGMQPDILLLDEPTSALDPELVGEVLAVVKKLAADDDMTMLIVTHEMSFCREVSDRVLFMDRGEIIEDAPPAKLFTNPDHPRIRIFLDKML
jgi:polar amino acid transport system ATP-binding protein